jgi:hypothetical protein
MGRLVLGVGFIAFGLQVLRPGFEPFVTDPALLPVFERLRADSILGVAACALLGATLVAMLQSPAPVLLLVLGLAQTTGHWNLRTALAVLSGSGLGAALGALLTTPAGARCRRLAQLHVLLGAASTVLAASTVDVWVSVADWLVAGEPQEFQWGRRVILPNLGKHLNVGFALSQLASAIVLLPFVPLLARWLERRWPEKSEPALASVGDVAGTVRTALLRVLGAQRDSLAALSDLALAGVRGSGRSAEHSLADAESGLEDLLSGPARALPRTLDGAMLGRVAFGCLQLERSLEALLHQAERLTDRRLEASVEAADVQPLTGNDQVTVQEMQSLFGNGLKAVMTSLAIGEPIDLEAARSRESRMTALEARARDALLAGEPGPLSTRRHIGVLELVDAYEAAGNQIYRLSETLAETYARSNLEAVV